MTVHPYPRCFYDLAPLGTRHSLERTPEGRAASRFDLEERDQMTAPGDHIQLNAADAKPMRDHFPAASLEIADRLLFAGEPPLVPGVGPIRWITVNAAGHAQEPSTPLFTAVTENVPEGRNISRFRPLVRFLLPRAP